MSSKTWRGLLGAKDYNAYEVVEEELKLWCWWWSINHGLECLGKCPLSSKNNGADPVVPAIYNYYGTCITLMILFRFLYIHRTYAARSLTKQKTFTFYLFFWAVDGLRIRHKAIFFNSNSPSQNLEESDA